MSNIKGRAGLATNRTKQVGHFLALRLVGVKSCRDAIGTTVKVVAGDHSRTRQLLAGDGYQASNQRQLVFGFGTHADKADQLVIRWPSGDEQTWTDVPIDSEWLAVEGCESLVELGK